MKGNVFHLKVYKLRGDYDMEKLKALALGNYLDAKYHPFTDVDKEIETIFQGSIDVNSTDDYNVLNKENLQEIQLFISYTEFSDQPLPAHQTAALLSFVANGGGLLAIHNGISLQRNQELGAMIGANFTGHPPFGTLPIQISEPSHPIMEGIQSFDIDDEPYRFDMYPHYHTTVIAEYEHEGKKWPAAWTHEFGLGRVVYLMPGHQLSAFHVQSYRELIFRSGLWATKQI